MDIGRESGLKLKHHLSLSRGHGGPRGGSHTPVRGSPGDRWPGRIMPSLLMVPKRD